MAIPSKFEKNVSDDFRLYPPNTLMGFEIIDFAKYPALNADARAKKLIGACADAFTWGAATMAGSHVAMPASTQVPWTSREKELVLASANEGKFAQAAPKTVGFSPADQQSFVNQLGSAIASGLNDSLAGNPEFTSYVNIGPMPGGADQRLYANYRAAYGVYQVEEPISAGAGEDETDKELAKSTGRNLLIGVGIAGLLAIGMWFLGKRIVKENPDELRLYQVNDEDESITLGEFISMNSWLTNEDREKLESLKVEEVAHFSGGSRKDWKIRRVY